MKFNEWLNKMFLEEALRNKTRPNATELARRLGTTQPVVSRWLNGDVEPSEKYLREIAKVYGLEVYDVLGLERPKTLVRALYFSPREPMTEDQSHAVFEAAKQIAKNIDDPVEREKTYIGYLEAHGIEHFSMHIEDKYDPEELDFLIDQLDEDERAELIHIIKERQLKGARTNEEKTAKGKNPTIAEHG